PARSRPLPYTTLFRSPEKVARGLLDSVSGLAAVSHVHVWQLTSGRTMATLHVRPHLDEEAKAVVRLVEQALREQFGIEHATVERSEEHTSELQSRENL